MLDLNDKNVELSIREDGQVVWLNINGRCAVRVTGVVSLLICDSRDNPVPNINELIAVEFGYRCCEKGMNLQEALAKAKGK